MKIYVDADACPVTRIAERVAKEHGIPVDANKTRLSNMTDKELMIMAITSLEKYAYRLDSLERQGANIEHEILESKQLFGDQGNSRIKRSETEYTLKNYGRFNSDECIQCSSHVDEETIDFIYDSLNRDNIDTCTADNLVDAMSALDSNIYNLCKSIIYQNFMSMRKIDRLYDLIGESGSIQ